MFFKFFFETLKATGDRKEYFRLCERYRCEGTVRHHTILQLGSLKELPDAAPRKVQVQRIEQLIEEGRPGKTMLFVPSEDKVEQLAVKLYAAIKQKERLDLAAGKDYHIVDVNSVKIKQVREAGTEWLCLKTLGRLQIREFMRKKECSEELIALAITHITSRAAYPASELRTSQWIKDNSAICELTGYDIQKR
jgi:hypothetical protein